MLEKCRQEIRESLDNVLCTFGGEDGGGKFARFYMFIEQLDVMAQASDEAAIQVLETVTKFSKLIDLAQNSRVYQK